jgi:hypothetical protein
MATFDDRWFEIWYSEGHTEFQWIPNYLLIVTTDEKEKGQIIVIDPQRGHAICFRGKDYEEVCAWLWADEFHLTEGRIFPDDGWGD